MSEEQTTFENMHEKRFNTHFTTNPLVIPVKGDGLDEEDKRVLKEIMKDAYCAVKEREHKEEGVKDANIL